MVFEEKEIPSFFFFISILHNWHIQLILEPWNFRTSDKGNHVIQIGTVSTQMFKFNLFEIQREGGKKNLFKIE